MGTKSSNGEVQWGGLLDEQASFWDHRELPHQYLIVESGQAPAEGQICVQWAWSPHSEVQGGGYIIVDPKEVSFVGFKQMIALELGIEDQIGQLRLCDSDGPQEPLEPVRDETHTLAKAFLQDNDCLIIEYGSPPQKGDITVSVSWLSDTCDGNPTKLGVLKTNSGSTLEDVKLQMVEQFGQMLCGNAAAAEACGTTDMMNPSLLRILQSHRRKCTNIHKPDTATLKQLSIAEGHEVVIKVLSAPEKLSQTQIVLNVARRNTQHRTVEDVREMVFDLQGLGASNLTEAVAQELQMEREATLIAKYIPHKLSWIRIPSNDELFAEEFRKAQKKQHKTKQPSLVHPPYMLRDGDLVAAGTDPDDDFNTAEDEAAKFAKAAEQGKTRAQKRNKGKQQPEEGIKFNLNKQSDKKKEKKKHEALANLTEMGFDENKILEALEATDMDQDEALNLLLASM